jgi:hypothetical protein
MAVETGAFVAGVGVLVALDTVSIALTFEAYRQAMKDQQARDMASTAEQAGREAEEQAQYAHTRLTRHLSRDHDRAVQEAAEAERQARREARAD